MISSAGNRDTGKIKQRLEKNDKKSGKKDNIGQNEYHYQKIKFQNKLTNQHITSFDTKTKFPTR